MKQAELAKESLRVLKDEGNLFFINYPKQNAYLRVKFLEDSEIILTKHLKRKFVSAEIDKIYYDMILERLKKNGSIPHKYKLQLGKKQSDKIINKQVDLFGHTT